MKKGYVQSQKWILTCQRCQTRAVLIVHQHISKHWLLICVRVRAIQEFEKGLMPKVVQHTSAHYGHGTSTIAVQEDTCESPPTKKPQPDRPVVESSIG